MGQRLSGNQAGNNHRQISLRRLRKATNDFNNNNRIGQGDSAFVFRGAMKHKVVAVKRLNPSVRRNADYEREVEMLSRLSHPNIINLIGFCVHDSEMRIERIVVYEYMPLRSLVDLLRHRQAGEVVLVWGARMTIGAGVAKGLSYLHNEAEPRVIFGDLKSADVLLGRGYHPKISDFGAAINIPPQSQTSIVQINPADRRMGNPYWAPEAIQRSALSPRTDVYSFGVLLLEIITGLDLPHDQQLVAGFLADMARNPANSVGMVDPELDTFEVGEVKKAMVLASLCMQRIPDARPAMSVVVLGMNNLAGEPGAVWPVQFDVAAAAE